MRVHGKEHRAVCLEEGIVYLIDQRLLPHRFEIVSCRTFRETAAAIQAMVVRGAGAIGAAAGFAMAQGVLEAPEAGFRAAIDEAADVIRATRPTAQDLFGAVARVREAAAASPTPELARQAALEQARALADENARAGEAIGRAGAGLLKPETRILTHCNAGWLAFVDWGSALAPIHRAHRQGVKLFVYATETRPRSQGAKLTAWELRQAGIPHVLIADTAVGALFQHGAVDCVIVGADRIAANGDVANKIGTYTIAVLAKRHGVPFYVAAPRSTLDPSIPNGASIPIEEREADEVLCATGLTKEGALLSVRIAPSGVRAYNPAFDVTPASLITSFITESGLVAPDSESLATFARQRPEAPVH